MEDLKAVITNPLIQQSEPEPTPMNEESMSEEDWPPTLGEHVVANFTEGFFIGEVIGIVDISTVKISYMTPKTILTAAKGERPRRYWIWPAKGDHCDTDRSSFINLEPCLTLSKPLFTRRMCVFACENAELLEIIANSVSEEV